MSYNVFKLIIIISIINVLLASEILPHNSITSKLCILFSIITHNELPLTLRATDFTHIPSNSMVSAMQLQS